MINSIANAGRDLSRVLRNGFAIWAIMFLLVSISGKTIWLMRPIEESWCRGDDYVQAAFAGIKVRDRWPVPESFAGQVTVNGRTVDTLFTFPGDPTPNSSRPKWATGFGVWRWYTSTMPTSVTMTMRHDDGTRHFPISFGPYRIPSNIAPCLEEEQ